MRDATFKTEGTAFVHFVVNALSSLCWQIGLIETGLLLPHGDARLEDLVMARTVVASLPSSSTDSCGRRRYSRNRCILEHPYEGRTLVRSILFSVTIFLC